jgi:hypothetical protein
MARPAWIFTHKAWKTTKANAQKKDSRFPDTGTGKALDKIEALYKKIDWDEFDDARKENIGDLQDFYKSHGVYINPFLRAVDAACDTIRKAKGMPPAGLGFARGMADAAGEFELGGAYFSTLIGAYKKLEGVKKMKAGEKAKIDKMTGALLKLSVVDALKNKAASEIFLKHAKKEQYDEEILFVLAVWGKVAPGKIYDQYIDDINIGGPTKQKIIDKYDAGDLQRSDLEPAVREICADNMMSRGWSAAVLAWRNEQYAKYGIPMPE